MIRQKLVFLAAMAIALLMVLFPPWSVKQRISGVAFAPEHAGRYAFIASPPNAARSDGWTTAVATVDLGRLLLQFVALALVAGSAAMIASMFPKAQRGQNAEHTREITATPRPNPVTRKAPWYCIGHLGPQGSGSAYFILVNLVIVGWLLSPGRSLPTSAAGAGAFMGCIMVTFALCAVFGWIVSGVTWKICKKSQSATMTGFVLGAVGILLLTTLGNARIDRARAVAAAELTSAQPAGGNLINKATNVDPDAAWNQGWQMATGGGGGAPADPLRDAISQIHQAHLAQAQIEVKLVAALPPGYAIQPVPGESSNPTFDRFDLMILTGMLDRPYELSPASCNQFAVGYFRGCMSDELSGLYEEALRRRIVPDPRIGWKGAAVRDRWYRVDEIFSHPAKPSPPAS